MKKKRQKIIIFYLILISVLILTLVLGIKSLKGSSELKQHDLDLDPNNPNDESSIVVYIAEIKEEEILISINVDGQEGFADSLTINLIDEIKINAERPDINNREYKSEINVLDIRKVKLSHENYFGSGYFIENIRLKLPKKNYLFPYYDYNVNFSINLNKGVNILHANAMTIQSYSSWLNISELSKQLKYTLKSNKTDQDLKNKTEKEHLLPMQMNSFPNSFSARLSYSLVYKWVTSLILISLLSLIFLINVLVVKKEKLDIESLGIIATMLIGLPTIVIVLKQNLITTLTIIDIVFLIYIVWLIIIPISHVYINYTKKTKQ